MDEAGLVFSSGTGSRADDAVFSTTAMGRAASQATRTG